MHAAIFATLVGGVGALWWIAELRSGATLPPRDVAAAPLRAARWIAARWRWRHQAKLAWQQGADIAAGLAAITEELPTLERARPAWHNAPTRKSADSCDWPPCPPRPPDAAPCRGGHCPDCGGTRCRGHREGACDQVDRDARPVYAAGMKLPRPGRHDLRVRLAAYRRRLHLNYLAQAVQLDPTWYAAKLGRPVQLGRAIGGVA